MGTLTRLEHIRKAIQDITRLEESLDNAINNIKNTDRNFDTKEKQYQIDIAIGYKQAVQAIRNKVYMRIGEL